MTYFLKITFISICFLLAYQMAIGQNLQEKMFQFKEVKDTGYVKAELFLLQSGNFCIVRYTKKANKVTGGTYVFSNDSLFLTFKPKIVTLGVHSKFKFYLREKKVNLPVVGFHMAVSNRDQLSGILYHETLPYASRTLDRSEEQDRLNSLQDSPEWKVLEGRKIRDLKRELKEENRRTK